MTHDDPRLPAGGRTITVEGLHLRSPRTPRRLLSAEAPALDTRTGIPLHNYARRPLTSAAGDAYHSGQESCLEKTVDLDARRRPETSDVSFRLETDGSGYVLAVDEGARAAFAISARGLLSRNLLGCFPADHHRLQRELAAALIGYASATINATLYPRERARLPVTIRLDAEHPSRVVWWIRRRTN